LRTGRRLAVVGRSGDGESTPDALIVPSLGVPLTAHRIVAVAVHRTNLGYRVVASDGGVLTSGDAPSSAAPRHSTPRQS